MNSQPDMGMRPVSSVGHGPGGSGAGDGVGGIRSVSSLPQAGGGLGMDDLNQDADKGEEGMVWRSLGTAGRTIEAYITRMQVCKQH